MIQGISHYRGLHQGKRLFVLASGPSLATHDLQRLRRRLVMGLNRSFLIYPDTLYHCCMDQRLFDIYPEQMKNTRCLFTIEGRPHGVPLLMLGAEGFSEDLSKGVYSGYTITYVALQLALYLGFSELYFLGLDLGHDSGKTHFFGSDFHSRNHPTTEFPKMRRMFELAAERLRGGPLQVFNCSPTTTLDCFPKCSFEEAVEL